MTSPLDLTTYAAGVQVPSPDHEIFRDIHIPEYRELETDPRKLALDLELLTIRVSILEGRQWTPLKEIPWWRKLLNWRDPQKSNQK
jgi:hypothetical protein